VTLIPDASIAAEYISRTPAGRNAAELLESEPLAAPELLDAEVLACIRKRVLAGELPFEVGRDMVDVLAAWPVTRMPHRPLLQAAFALLANFTSYDAFYVAAALATGSTLVTADAALARAPLPAGLKLVFFPA
jgi:predicted nucleic acid-binding protein